jgi:tetratricopeptide (TPR) repeat protein
MLVLLLWIAGLSWAGHAAVASPSTSSPRESWALLAHADSLFRSRQPDSALVLLEPLQQESRSRNDDSLFQAVRMKQGEILATYGRAIPAEAALREVLAAVAATAQDAQAAVLRLRAMRWLAYTLELQGRMKESASYYDSTLELAQSLGDREHEGYARLGLAYHDLLAGQTATAVSGFEQAVARFRELGLHRYELVALNGLGRCHDALGDLDRARSVYTDVARRSQELGDPYTEARALNNLGALEFVLGDPAVAVEFYRRARDLHLAHGNPEGSIVPAKNIAVAQTYMGQYDAAARVLEEAASVCREQGYLGQRVMILEQLGIVRRLQGRLLESAALLREASIPNLDLDPLTRVRVAMGLAETLAAMDSVKVAIALLDEAAQEWRERTGSEGEVHLDLLTGELLFHAREFPQALSHLLRAENSARRLGLSMERIGPLTFGARCYRALGQPDSCLALLLRASGVWETLRGRSRDPEWRERLGIDAHLLYISLGDFLSEYPGDRPAPARARTAFESLQRFKARTLHERMIGPSCSPADTSLPWPEVSTRLEDVQQALEEGELFLDAYLGTDASLFFAVDRRECRVIHLPGREESSEPEGSPGLSSSLERFRGLLAHPPDDPGPAENQRFLDAAGAALGELLLSQAADLVSRCRRIIVAPDGPLNLIPLGAIGVPGTGGAETELLLARCEVVHVPSAALLVELRHRSSGNRAREDAAGLLAVAAGNGGPDSSLPGALGEARWLGRHFRHVDVRAQHAKAVRVEELSRYHVLHLATHTRLDDQRPWRSSIVVAASDSSREGRLRASDIASLRLGARLAVLSGCESAGGHVLSGEGVLGLTGAFAAAGVPAVIATLWPVQDRVTARLMKEVYISLGRGETVAAALRRAQLAMRDDPDTRHPFYWAGFVLVGDGSVRVDLQVRPWWMQPAVLILPVVLLAIGLLGAARLLRAGGHI